jgi:hypothetical protein
MGLEWKLRMSGKFSSCKVGRKRRKCVDEPFAVWWESCWRLASRCWLEERQTLPGGRAQIFMLDENRSKIPLLPGQRLSLQKPKHNDGDNINCAPPNRKTSKDVFPPCQTKILASTGHSRRRKPRTSSFMVDSV